MLTHYFDAFPKVIDSTAFCSPRSLGMGLWELDALLAPTLQRLRSKKAAIWMHLGHFGSRFLRFETIFEGFKATSYQLTRTHLLNRRERIMASTCRLNSGTSERTSWSLCGFEATQRFTDAAVEIRSNFYWWMIQQGRSTERTQFSRFHGQKRSRSK